ncbi:hypothetical protein NDU88_007364 [Pleurodeles waltl]|uniref:Uncharacterized protein n=1 Tax=Pleurodeles waltl TaxID=8319 RepID=A0AAV7QKE9_PLEWA|nr:hypothetical protein NDU88_007364 [Pleurodeles waltl]
MFVCPRGTSKRITSARKEERAEVSGNNKTSGAERRGGEEDERLKEEKASEDPVEKGTQRTSPETENKTRGAAERFRRRTEASHIPEGRGFIRYMTACVVISHRY